MPAWPAPFTVRGRLQTAAGNSFHPNNEWFVYDVLGRLSSASNDVGAGHNIAREYSEDSHLKSETIDGHSAD